MLRITHPIASNQSARFDTMTRLFIYRHKSNGQLFRMGKARSQIVEPDEVKMIDLEVLLIQERVDPLFKYIHSPSQSQGSLSDGIS
jgi:hypothetical protein